MIIPSYLQPGDKVGIVATAKVVNKENTLYGIRILEEWGLEVIVGKHLFAKHFQFAGTDQQRKEDFQYAINNPEIKAVFLVRGGYGSSRIIDLIDFKPLLDNPKWICGFSDITILHSHLYRLGLCSFHAPMLSFFHALDSESIRFFRSMIFGKKESFQVASHSLNIPGKATGRLVGGNLSIICHAIGTDSAIITAGNLLFLEDIGENLYHIDRMMVQLKRVGLLENLAGLIVGQFSDMKDNADSFGLNAEEIISSHIIEYNFPAAFNFPIGHTAQNYAVPIGKEATFTIDENKDALLEIN
jgi:muramoyltetrapeptide carboxypeptidase